MSDRLGLRPGDPLEPIVASLGGKIEYKNPVSTGAEIPESIRIRSDKDFTIYLPSMTSTERDRFTIAHELGHFFMHYPIVRQQFAGAQLTATRWVEDTPGDPQRAEWEANWFAAAFLMPSKAFRDAFHEYGTAVSVAIYFGVSTAAAETRAKTLGLSE